MNRFLSGIVVIGVALTSTAAYSRDSQVAVSYADLNLAAPAGKEALLQRINFAANRVCGSMSYGMSRFNQAPMHDRCVAEATARAMDSLPSYVAEQISPRNLRTASLGR